MEFYGGTHHVWCSPVFNPDSLDRSDPRSRIPPSSSPYHIYRGFKDSVDKNDMHSRIIENNIHGIQRGAAIMLEEGTITTSSFGRINDIISRTTTKEFSPRLLVIPYHRVRKKVIRVDVDKTANPLSIEYLIKDLKPSEFHAIEF